MALALSGTCCSGGAPGLLRRAPASLGALVLCCKQKKGEGVLGMRHDVGKRMENTGGAEGLVRAGKESKTVAERWTLACNSDGLGVREGEG